MASRPPRVATTSTLAMLKTAESRGCPTGDLLEAAGLEREILEDPDARIDVPAALALWDALRERTGDPALQLAAPTILPFGAYRVIDYMVDASGSLGDGIRRFARFFRLIADDLALTVEEEGEERRLHLARADGGAVRPVYVDYVFAALVGRIRMKIRPALEVKRVELRQSTPPDPSPYAACFRAPVHFGEGGDRLCFGLTEWESRLEHADEALALLLEQHARLLEDGLPEVSGGFVAEVRTALTAALPEDAQAAGVARALHVSVRTLQRRLAAAGTTFREVLDEARKILAEGYLSDPRVSIVEVAFLLGFSDQTSFNRAFRRWTDVAPGVWRRRVVGRGRGPGARHPPGG